VGKTRIIFLSISANGTIFSRGASNDFGQLGRYGPRDVFLPVDLNVTVLDFCLGWNHAVLLTGE
jgi:hypothetical protein